MASPEKQEYFPAHEEVALNDASDFSQNHTDSDDPEDFNAVGERSTWSKKTEYLLSVIGYCVGLSNIWRFPYVCMRNGGGAFLIPFFFALFICAFPVYFMELAMGQFLGRGTWHVWNICPLFRGLGISMIILCCLFGWYYSMILGWCLIYLVNSFKSPLPWIRCDHAWNTDNCMTPDGFRSLNQTDPSSSLDSLVQDNGTYKVAGDGFNGTQVAVLNRTWVSSTEEFWTNSVLELSSGIDDMGGLPWHTVLSLVVANFFICVAVIKGIHSSGKVVYVTATLPYLLLTIILIMGCTLPGSGDGLLFYIKPDFKKLFKFRTWVEAFIQVFYSLGNGWGSLITMASYNKFHNNCWRDSLMLTIICEGTSVFGGFAIFSILGHMAYIAKKPIMDFAKSGAGLAFIVYPEAIYYLPVPQLWGFVFFFMLFTLGLDSQFANVETMVTTFADIWPKYMRRWRVVVTMAVMAFFTLVGLVFTARGGGYVFQIVDWYIAAFSMFIQAALECVIIGWIYGADRFCYDIELMIGSRPPYAIVIGWKFVCPFCLMVLFFITLISYEPPVFSGYSYPSFAETLGWCLAIFPFLSVVLFSVFVLARGEGSLLQRVTSACKPSPSWFPANAEARKKYHFDAMGSSNTVCRPPCT